MVRSPCRHNRNRRGTLLAAQSLRPHRHPVLGRRLSCERVLEEITIEVIPYEHGRQRGGRGVSAGLPEREISAQAGRIFAKNPSNFRTSGKDFRAKSLKFPHKREGFSQNSPNFRTSGKQEWLVGRDLSPELSDRLIPALPHQKGRVISRWKNQKVQPHDPKAQHKGRQNTQKREISAQAGRIFAQNPSRLCRLFTIRLKG